MNKLVIVFAVIVASCNLARGFNRNKCMRPWGKMNFDHEKYSGEWFVVAKALSPAVPMIPSSCNKAVYSFKKDVNTTHVTIDLSMKVGDKELKFVSKSQPIDPHGGSVSQAAWKKEGEDTWTVFSLAVLATDYQDFAVMHACRQIYDADSDVFDKFEIIQVLSRKPEMESKLMEVLKKVLSSFDIGGDEMTMIDNTKC